MFGIILIATIPVQAQEITIKSIDPSEYYDSKPCIWGNYIVWRRAINQNDNEYIELREPSWIMVHDIDKGRSWNITEKNLLMYGSDIYCHAEAPEIQDGRIIYEAQGSGNSWDTRLFMYNISSKKTWEIPLKSTDYAHGHLHLIHDDWIAYTHKENGKRQAYLLNYADGNYRTIVGKNENYSVYGMVMWEDTVVITALNNSDGFEILTYDIGTTMRESIGIGFNYSKAIATTIHEDRVGINILEEQDNSTQWNCYIYDLESDTLTKLQDGIYGLLIWGNQMAYEHDGNIFIQNQGQDIVITSIGKQYLGDIYDNALVWMDNSNSEGDHGDARDNTDVFVRKRITPEEIFWNNWYFILILIVIIVIGLLFRGSGKEGMV